MMLTIQMMALTPWKKGGFETGQYRNLFVEMGYKQVDVDAKLKAVFDDETIVVMTTMAVFMIANNIFNDALQVEPEP